MFRVVLIKDIDYYFPKQQYLTDFYKREIVSFVRGTNWTLHYNPGYSWVSTGLSVLSFHHDRRFELYKEVCGECTQLNPLNPAICYSLLLKPNHFFSSIATDCSGKNILLQSFNKFSLKLIAYL